MGILERKRPVLVWAAGLGLLAGMYAVTNFSPPYTLGREIGGIDMMLPVLWTLIAAAFLVLLRFGGLPASGTKRMYIWLGLLLGLFHLAGIVISGLVYGFGSSPMSNGYPYLFMNLAYWMSVLAAFELGRALLLRPFAKRHTTAMVLVFAIFFAFLSLPWHAFAFMGGGWEAMPFLGGTFLPLLAKGLLAGALAVSGGPLAAMAYMGAMTAFEWHSPILPHLDWIMKALIGTTLPLTGLVVLQFMNETPAPKRTQAKTQRRVSPAWIITGLLCFLLVWVTLVPLGIRPVSVATGSMAPALHTGDLVLVRHVAADTISVGDVIQFRSGDTTIIHRVVAVDDDSHLHFYTKGDANNDMDSEPVMGGQVIGRVSLTIPKLGWISVWARNVFG